MGLSISQEGIRAPGFKMDHNGLKMPGLTIDHNGIQTPIASIDHNGFRTREINLFPSQNRDYTKPLLIGLAIGLVSGATLTYALTRRSYRRGRSNSE